MEEDSQGIADHLCVWDQSKLFYLHETEKNDYDGCVAIPLKCAATFYLALAMF